MNRLRFFDIIHREHVYCNPMSIDKFEELIALTQLEPGDRVLEIATGKGEFLIRLAEQYTIEGTGVDISPYFLSDALQKKQQRIPSASLRFIEMDAKEYKPKPLERFHMAACIGGSWIYGGHRETLQVLNEMTVPGGWVIVGEPHWRQEPAAAYLDAIGKKRHSFGTHNENMQAGHELGLNLVYTIVSNQDDWDRYEGLQWYSADEWLDKNPDDTDAEEVKKRVHANKENYLRWGRDTLGWAIYMFKKSK